MKTNPDCHHQFRPSEYDTIMAQVVEINSIDELENYFLVWNSLLLETPKRSFFQSLDWLTCFWRHFGHRMKLRVLVVYSGGRPIGIVPLVVLREKTRVGQIRLLTYPLHDWSSYYGPIGPNPAATLAAAMQYLKKTRRDWDMVDLRWIDRHGLDRGRTETAMKTAGLSCHASVWKQFAVINMSCRWDEYFASRTSKFRNNIRRAEKKVAQLGEIRYQRYRPQSAAEGDGDPRWDLYDACVELASRSWQGASTTGTTLSHDCVRDFFRDTHDAAARTGALDMSMLWVDDRLAAFGYNYATGGRISGLRAGTDPELHQYGVGTLHYARMFEDCFGRGDELFDFGPGSLEQKRYWLTDIESSYRYTHFAQVAPRAQILRLKRVLKPQSPGTTAKVASRSKA